MDPSLQNIFIFHSRNQKLPKNDTLGKAVVGSLISPHSLELKTQNLTQKRLSERVSWPI